MKCHLAGGHLGKLTGPASVLVSSSVKWREESLRFPLPELQTKHLGSAVRKWYLVLRAQEVWRLWWAEGAFTLGLEWTHSLNKCLLSTYCVPGPNLTYMVSFQFILTPACVEGTSDQSPLTDEKTTGRRSKGCSARDGESVPGRGENVHVGREAGKPGGEG